MVTSNYKLKLFLCSVTIFLVVYLSTCSGKAQGISFSYLIPKDGYLSAPVSPFSVRGVGFRIAPFTRLESGFSLYSMSGLAMDGLPFEADAPLVGPHFTLLIPAEIVFTVGIGRFGMSVMGGGLGLWHINPRINYGEMDRAIAEWEDWQVVNADLDMDAGLGGGWLLGGGLEYDVNDQLTLTAETHYIEGYTSAPLTGTYTGGPDEEGNIITKDADFPDARIALEGIEIALGVRLRPR